MNSAPYLQDATPFSTQSCRRSFFLLVNGLVSFQAAMWSALALSVVIAAVRISRKQSLIYALAGVGKCGSCNWHCMVPRQVGGIFSARSHQRKHDIASHHRQPGHPPPDGGVDKLHRPPLATGLVLASAGATRLQRSDFRLGIIFRRPPASAIFAL